jgi:hypothetical protein
MDNEFIVKALEEPMQKPKPIKNCNPVDYGLFKCCREEVI